MSSSLPFSFANSYSYLLSIILKIVLVSFSSPNLLVSIVQTTSIIHPEALWMAINNTLELDKIGKRPCVKVTFYNNYTQLYIDQPNITHSDSLFINTDESPDVGFATEEILQEVRKGIDSTSKSLKKNLPCILVFSIVNVSLPMEEARNRQPISDDGQGDEWLNQGYKYELSQQFTKLLQYRTPMAKRHLVIVRFGRGDDDFGQCRRASSPFPRYPRRLVPIWEQVLFDYFPSARAIHVIEGEKSVPTRRERGDFVWICDDIIKRLEDEDYCREREIGETGNGNSSDHPWDPRCEKNVDSVGKLTSLQANLSNCSSYTPRH